MIENKKEAMRQVMSYYKNFFFVILCFLLSGCGKVVDWVTDSFQQVSSLDSPCDRVQKYIQSVTEYDQFTTAAKFDALWLSNEVRMAYVDLFGLKFGKTEEQKKALLRRQLEENNHFISFYVLSSHDVPLGDAYSTWALFLHINGKNYAPIEIKVIDLSPEYICMFGKKHNRFKVAYSVKFDAKNIDDAPLLDADISVMTLYFRSVKKEVSLEWNLASTRNMFLSDEELPL